MSNKILTPLKSVRKKCLACCAGSSHEVKLCTCVDCALWPWRLGHKPTKEIKTLYESGAEIKEGSH